MKARRIKPLGGNLPVFSIFSREEKTIFTERRLDPRVLSGRLPASGFSS
jgi:hypothetical protein